MKNNYHNSHDKQSDVFYCRNCREGYLSLRIVHWQWTPLICLLAHFLKSLEEQFGPVRLRSHLQQKRDQLILDFIRTMNGQMYPFWQQRKGKRRKKRNTLLPIDASSGAKAILPTDYLIDVLLGATRSKNIANHSLRDTGLALLEVSNDEIIRVRLWLVCGLQ